MNTLVALATTFTKSLRHTITIGLLLTSIAIRSSAAGSVHLVADEYVHRVWSERDGLISSRIWSITQDRDGYLWLGSDVGLLRFDGVRAVFQPTRSAAPRPEDRVLALLAAHDGSLWAGFGAGGGVTRLVSTGPVNYGPEQGLLTGRVTDIVEDLDGDIWVAANRGLFMFHNGTWHTVGAGSSLPAGQVNGLHVDAIGSLTAATPQGIFQKQRRQSTFALINPIASVQAVQFTLHKSDGLLVTDDHAGYAPVALQPSSTQASRYGRGIQLLSDLRDRLWLATEAHGLWIINGVGGPAENVSLSTQEGVDSNTVRALFEDREGNVWVGTLSGLHEFSPRVIGTTRLETPFSILSGDGGRMLVGSAGTLAEVSPAGDVMPMDESVPGVTNVRALYRDHSGTIWIGSDAGVFRLVGRRPVLVSEAAQLKNLTSIAGTRDGTIYLCDQHKGLFRWQKGRMSAFSHPLDRENLGAASVFGDRHDRVWFGYPAGRLGLIDIDGAARWFSPADGLTTGSLTSLYEDQDGDVWIGGNEGVSLFSGGQFQTLHGNREHAVSGITGIGQDAQNDLWLGVISGIIHFRKTDFIKAAHTGESLEHARYDQADGLAGLPIWLAATPTVAAASDGRLWFVTSAGLSVVDPLRLSAHTSAPVARIEQIRLRQAASNRLEQFASYFMTPDVHIEYTALSFRAPAKLRFRYRLEGHDSEWIDANSSRRIDYVNLPPGDYRFSVTAAESSGVWSEQTASADLVVPTPPLRSRWAYTTAVLLLGGAALGLWGLRLRRLKRQLAAVLAERIRMSHEIHDTLVQGLVGIALQLDATSAAVTDPTSAQQLSNVRRRVEQYIGDAREAIRTLRLRSGGGEQVWDALEQTGLTLGQSHGFDFDLKRSLGPPGRPPRPCEQQLLRIGQEAVFNAAKHAGATRVCVQVEYTTSATILRVSDDGCGFSEEPAKDAHFGIRIMRERAEQVGGHLEIQSHLGHGTSVTATVPL